MTTQASAVVSHDIRVVLRHRLVPRVLPHYEVSCSGMPMAEKCLRCSRLTWRRFTPSPGLWTAASLDRARMTIDCPYPGWIDLRRLLPLSSLTFVPLFGCSDTMENSSGITRHRCPQAPGSDIIGTAHILRRHHQQTPGSTLVTQQFLVESEPRSSKYRLALTSSFSFSLPSPNIYFRGFAFGKLLIIQV
ncbi:hypothetical protein BD310DRAFT_229186 [Dichomitus squalens]|uniref:Uncharacterized protein n=1 Tax=Dichomitus squalens TaxID=114155 RepID=A0A4Q9PCW7_9APHY|nr:hypothetical protein BD310DRAFT_229186 [Dichomitus squalens]